MLQLESITKAFRKDFWSPKVKVLDSVSFGVLRGEVVGFLGANGAGKTTTMKIIMDFVRPCSGKVKWNPSFGQDIQTIRSKIGYMPERPYFYPQLTGKSFIHYMGKLNHMTDAKIQASCDFWANRLKIDFALDRKIKTYSKGMLQRIGFMATVLHDPELILLDEPLSGLDPVGRKEIKEAILDLKKKGKTVFFSSHIVPDVEEVCEKVIFLEFGKLVYEGSIDEIVRSRVSLNYHVGTFGTSMSDLKVPHRVLKYSEHDQFSLLEVRDEYKDALVREILNHHGNIASLHKKIPKLEEVFYKLKENSS